MSPRGFRHGTSNEHGDMLVKDTSLCFWGHPSFVGGTFCSGVFYKISGLEEQL